MPACLPFLKLWMLRPESGPGGYMAPTIWGVRIPAAVVYRMVVCPGRHRPDAALAGLGGGGGRWGKVSRCYFAGPGPRRMWAGHCRHMPGAPEGLRGGDGEAYPWGTGAALFCGRRSST